MFDNTVCVKKIIAMVNRLLAVMKANEKLILYGFETGKNHKIINI